MASEVHAIRSGKALVVLAADCASNAVEVGGALKAHLQHRQG
jgi:hypothetical protein